MSTNPRHGPTHEMATMTTTGSPSGRRRSPASGNHAPGWVTLVVVLGALLTAAGAVIALINPTLLSGPDLTVTTAVAVYAHYTFSRNLALSLLLLTTLALRAHRVLAGLMVLTALIQLIDIIDDLTDGRAVLAPGLLLFAVAFLVGATALTGHAPWTHASWRDDTSRHRP